ncbi:hypothetical protein BD413DRAFT_119601 [Trametes elegans]|nr:hypothetical protein BD413DRAFT_119601 [Trametes elegans]
MGLWEHLRAMMRMEMHQRAARPYGLNIGCARGWITPWVGAKGGGEEPGGGRVAGGELEGSSPREGACLIHRSGSTSHGGGRAGENGDAWRAGHENAKDAIGGSDAVGAGEGEGVPGVVSALLLAARCSLLAAAAAASVACHPTRSSSAADAGWRRGMRGKRVVCVMITLSPPPALMLAKIRSDSISPLRRPIHHLTHATKSLRTASAERCPHCPPHLPTESHAHLAPSSARSAPAQSIPSLSRPRCGSLNKADGLYSTSARADGSPIHGSATEYKTWVMMSGVCTTNSSSPSAAPSLLHYGYYSSYSAASGS